MKVIGITGSPREKSNTEYYVQYTLDKIKEHGIETELITLRDKKIHHCTGCYGCITAKECTLEKDDFEEVFNKMLEADGILVGSPVYNSSSTAIVKALLDRAGFLGRWINNDMKDKSENYQWKGTAFSGKVAAPITVARRAGQNFTFAELALWMTVNDLIVIGSHYWNVGVAGKGGAVDAEEDLEGASIMDHLADNMAHVIKQLKK
ncbi:flavodoxin family protein [Serpentinicella sp. ANB-PHB4]|uniref:flavodoxin family protein n=1 Tax=Serpentinicella sp. ANB-PHB4 TaxID=3074076 RepID=UPI002859BAF1|nr:flavodoxin family protein [Serpentinicella sp. ANB-PHB4]MDR5658006.1 flavodoxin family protein [Serpentinicella sp. ANB-PHB4]